MSNIDITPEDRERLAKTKFGEWFDEFWDKKFNEAFEKSLTQARKSTPSQSSSAPPEEGQQFTPPKPQRKRSLLETCLTDTFGF